MGSVVARCCNSDNLMTRMYCTTIITLSGYVRSAAFYAKFLMCYVSELCLLCLSYVPGFMLLA